ncbi:hypothetical protein C8A03DRAFT_39402 [Achaetomium macrosporum]|uniref:Uncharacterized protein n=1 Tax=Achaetomium macrosporum TaxID=79813 RepID=A0AAN7C0B7_9PEZI|nr:hypothetical protein C8A03DRAFT_39402 [Achaetomium macrosporum]
MSSSRAGSTHSGSTPDVSSLEFDASGTQPSALEEPFKTNLTSKLGKIWKSKFPKAKKALIKGQAHVSHTAPEQGKVVSVRLFDAAGKKVVETIHLLASGEWFPGKQYYKDKRKAGSSSGTK